MDPKLLQSRLAEARAARDWDAIIQIENELGELGELGEDPSADAESTDADEALASEPSAIPDVIGDYTDPVVDPDSVGD